MITWMRGDILKSQAEALVNTVNCVGVMGRGIALQFDKAFPDNSKAYKSACDRRQLRLGQVFVYDLGRFENPKYVINFPTKDHWRGKSRIEDIRAGLVALVREVQNRQIRSLAVPPLGCGLGGLEWGQVRPLIEETLVVLSDVQVFLYEPAGAPKAAAMVNCLERPRMTVGRAGLIELIHRYLAGLMDNSVSLLEIHKLMYFLQEAGESLKLRYTKAEYGPYAENLRHVLNLLEGHFITGYGDGDDAPGREIELKAGAAAEAEAFLQGHPGTQARFKRVADLIQGFETPYGLELLSTVHWVMTREGAKTKDQAIDRTYAWGERKRMFQPEHIKVAWRALEQKGWKVV